jgi:hypothetical protein
MAILLFLPHIWWQVIHDYPSVKYHLIYRSSDPYRFDFTLDYLLGQILVTGPLIGVLILFAAITYRTGDLFEKSLKYTFVGIFVFFFLSSFKGWVEANWTIPAFIPLIILAHQKIHKSALRKWVLYLAIPSVVFILLARLLLMTNILPELGIKTQFHNWDVWAKQIEEKAADRPVVFQNSYQLASKYTFYAQKTGHSLNAYNYRKNMYDIWGIENGLQGGKALFYCGYPLAESDTFVTIHKDKVFLNFIDDYRSYNKIEISLNTEEKLQGTKDSLELEIKVANHFKEEVDFNANPNLPVYLSVPINKNNDIILNGGSFLLNEKIQPEGHFIKKIKIALPKEPGEYRVKFGISAGFLPSGYNSQPIKLVVLGED